MLGSLLAAEKFEEMVTESSKSIELGSDRINSRQEYTQKQVIRTTYMNNPPQNEVRDRKPSNRKQRKKLIHAQIGFN